MAEVAEGTVVDGRYRIVRRIGSGGMADVYCAEDSQLGRQIALKMLHRRFSRDREFVERFRREASAAAALSHPNVVGVYDRGEFDGTYYIAMEYLPGRTLKEVIREEAPLSQDRAVAFTLQILAAASFAHRRGVIHRDFKPHNVIVGDGNRLKVTDFGIARAGASEMTETGSIMGTAQYLSPEQAQGQRVGAPSDLYSIGVILYELLTGRVPFTGESAVSIALKHVSEEPPPLRSLREDVHPRLEQIVGRALLKDPAQRFASADEFAAALEQARAEIASGENGGTGSFVAAPVPVDPDDEEERGRRWPLVALALLFLAVAVIAALTQGWFVADTVSVPKVTGERATRATVLLEREGFEVKTHPVESSRRVGTVVSQDPRAGSKAKEGSTVDLAVSSGPGKAIVPSVVNLSQAEATRELNDAGFRVVADRQPSSSVPRGTAIRTSPKEGAVIPRDSEVRLFVSSGPRQVTVPGVVGQPEASARGTLSDAGLSVTRVLADSDAPKGQVIGQDPSAGASVDEGSRVTITVSRGPQKVRVPDVVGQDRGSATATLRDAGLSVNVVERESASDDEGTVIRQSPPGGSSVNEGTAVTIYVARAPEEPEGPGVDPDDPGADDSDDGGSGGTPGVEPDG